MDNKEKDTTFEHTVAEEIKSEEIPVEDTEVIDTSKETKKKEEPKKRKTDPFKKFCYMCRRTEEQAGKLTRMSGDIHICQDCLQKTFDTMNSGNFGIFDMGSLDNGQLDLSSLLGGRMPGAKKVKEKKKDFSSWYASNASSIAEKVEALEEIYFH